MNPAELSIRNLKSTVRNLVEWEEINVYIHPRMHPRLIANPYFTIYTFGVLLATAYLTALWWVVRRARRAGMDPDPILSVCL